MSEEAYVQDSIHIYKWVRRMCGKKKVYFWGISMGSIVATETVALLKDEGVVPTGLVLEATTTSFLEVATKYTVAKVGRTRKEF